MGPSRSVGVKSLGFLPEQITTRIVSPGSLNVDGSSLCAYRGAIASLFSLQEAH